ncbi:MAG: peroxiredoxin-like family protein [Solirubrobacteraceae bacterium]
MVSTELADITLPDHDGRPVALGQLWSVRPAAIVWLRHYGCLYCRAHARAIQGAADDFAAAGIDPVLIGMGTAENAAEFRSHLELDLPVLADRRRVSYGVVGARMGGITGLASPRVLLRAVPTMLRGQVRQGRTVGHPAQLGASAVIAPGGEVLFHHIAHDASDNAAPEALLGAAVPA